MGSGRKKSFEKVPFPPIQTRQVVQALCHTWMLCGIKRSRLHAKEGG